MKAISNLRINKVPSFRAGIYGVYTRIIFFNRELVFGKGDRPLLVPFSWETTSFYTSLNSR